MLETPHAIVGAVIVSKVVNPYLGLSLAFLSHFVLDKVPHWNPKINTDIKQHNIAVMSDKIKDTPHVYGMKNRPMAFSYTPRGVFRYLGSIKKVYVFVAIDIITALIAGFLMALSQLPDTRMVVLIIAGAFLGVLPDITKYPYFLFSKLRYGVYKKWVLFEKSLQVDVDFIPGVFVQVTLIILSLVWFFS
ncbi:hypothetical protein IPM62_02805 [Candidatus Woesebacteria bacterium]|nr:MAG: hypothetical protein IPM62_02805 [Candidatus Woesebacteria bacterium]